MFHLDRPAPQMATDAPAFDTWREPSGEIVATFHRLDRAILLRFAGTADFLIDIASHQVRAVPVDPGVVEATRILLENSIAPLLANYRGGTNLHGSAVSIAGHGVAFLGVSRRGKSTLAGAFASAGHPFLAEDVLALSDTANGWTVEPHSGALRLFPDSAAQFGVKLAGRDKEALGEAALPRARSPVPLRAIYLLGDGSAQGVALTSLVRAEALSGLLRHAFVLDVEDRPRLAAHFGRLADLAAAVPCRQLDYPRRYDLIPQVITAVVDDLART